VQDEIDMVIVGGGEDEQMLRHLSIELCPGRVHFAGWVSDDTMKANYYNASECLTLNSWREASPAVIGEAFSCGIPVVSSHVGGIDDLVIEGRTGWLFPPGDDAALGGIFSLVARQPEMIRQMRDEIRKVAVEKVSEEAISASLKKGFEKALHGR
jgi:glycosyltransferase involved in cell wall biosynthesis